MDFDPDAYLAKKTPQPASTGGGFDPDAYLAKKQARNAQALEPQPPVAKTSQWGSNPLTKALAAGAGAVEAGVGMASGLTGALASTAAEMGVNVVDLTKLAVKRGGVKNITDEDLKQVSKHGKDIQGKVQGAIQYTPKTQAGADITEGISGALEASKLPPVMPGLGMPARLAPSAAKEAAGGLRNAAELASPAVAKAAQALANSPEAAVLSKGVEQIKGILPEKGASTKKAVAGELAPELAQPSAQAGIQQAAQLAQKIPGMKPTLGQATGSPFIQARERHFVTTEPTAYEKAVNVQAGLDKAVSGYAEKRFPKVSDVETGHGVKTAAAEKSARLENALSDLDRRDRQLAQRHARGEAGMEEIGAQALAVRENLLKTATAVKNDKYNKVSEAAKAVGLKVDMSDVKTLATTLTQDEAMLFQNDPGVVGKILRRYADRAPESKLSPTQEKYKFPVAPKEASGERLVPFDEFHSLLKDASSEASALQNAASRGDVAAREKLFVLNKVKDLLSNKVNALETVDKGGVGSLLKEANQFYAQQFKPRFLTGVGGEMAKKDAFGMSTEQAKIIPTLVFKEGSAEGVKEWLRMAAGNKEAHQVLENGVMDMFSKAVVKEGKVNQTSINAFLKKYKEPLAELPGIRSKIDSVQKAAASLAESRKMVIAEKKAFGDSTIAKIAKMEKPDTVIAAALESPKIMSALLETAGTGKERQAIANSLMSHVASEGKPLEFMEKNAVALEGALGKTQFGFLKTLMAADDLASRTAVPRTVPYAESKMGMPIAATAAISPKYAAAKGAIQWWRKLTRGKRDALMQDVIFNPEHLKELNSYLKLPTKAKEDNLARLTMGEQ